MSRKTLRIFIFLAALSIGGITVTQVYWFRRAFDIRESQFTRDVNSALLNVANRIFEINKTPSPANNPIQQLSTNYFVVMVNGPIEVATLEFLLLQEFEKRGLQTDFEYGIYDCTNQCMVYGNYISLTTKSPEDLAVKELPEWGKDNYYFGVQFPRYEANIISQMGIWGFSTAVMLLVILFFLYALFVILKQKRLSEIQKDFINTLTHEFKTPISTIAISSEVLKDPRIVQNPERLLNYATIIENENNRLKQQVERVLQIAELDKDEIHLKKERVDVHELLHEVIRNSSVQIAEHKAQIKFDLLSTQSHIIGDRLHVANVFFNLLDNALKYTQSIPELIIRTYNRNSKIFIEFEDRGKGISPENQKKIFDRFYRIPTGDVHNVKGFGLGLYYIKLIVKSHQGIISLQSEPGKGSTFIIEFPIA
ncbi:MAG: HAMP domain-containing histidine kinase [Flammeovirgaceae bacterium]|nr:HAMP domain-containing histidine kinase [Flammeovirgaceae bacterium]